VDVIFLDIDGVLLTHSHRSFDPRAQALVLRLIQETRAKVVISSSWAVRGKETVLSLFQINGVRLGPLLHEQWSAVDHADRNVAIRRWLATQRPARFVAIDDWPLALEQAVRTDPALGFTEADYAAAARLMGVGPTPRP